MTTKLKRGLPDAQAGTARSGFAHPIPLKPFQPLTICAGAATGDGSRVVKPFRL